MICTFCCVFFAWEWSMTKQYIEHNLKFMKTDPFNIPFTFKWKYLKETLFLHQFYWNYLPWLFLVILFLFFPVQHSRTINNCFKTFVINKMQWYTESVSLWNQTNLSVLYESSIFGVSLRNVKIVRWFCCFVCFVNLRSHTYVRNGRYDGDDLIFTKCVQWMSSCWIKSCACVCESLHLSCAHRLYAYIRLSSMHSNCECMCGSAFSLFVHLRFTQCVHSISNVNSVTYYNIFLLLFLYRNPCVSCIQYFAAAHKNNDKTIGETRRKTFLALAEPAISYHVCTVYCTCAKVR